ncbi:uncharacterized protein EV154DRAFT_522284 [Mucor mucedo]|uniref:uncharacterized protein n=1 Tax=Mucor mucedo TaxID=29922 RepID=UPI00221E4FEA|nr:uncharacterized protein EV154DRAFT_522284 [Mucor mucedo]KAI7884482.1 hypothetical protein EV154DRAFT_522284 [Mucor mucedo]
MYKQILVLFFLVAAVAAETAYFAFKTYGSTDDFVIQLTDDKLIKHARDLVSGATTDEPHLHGRIRKQTASYNPKYSFQLDPATIGFFNMAIEVCDAYLPYVEEHLDEACGAFLPGCVYCPWTSQITREIK